MSDNTAGVITIIVVVVGFFVLPNFIDAWQARGVAKYNALEAEHQAEAARLANPTQRVARPVEGDANSRG